MKVIQYRGGLVTFKIPTSWHEEYEPDGGGTFFEDRPDSGTLRLNVLTMESKRGIGDDAARDVFSQRSEGQDITKLPNGNAVFRYIKTAAERGEELRLHYWEVANPVPPRHMRLGVFSYAILSRKASDAATVEEIHMLDKYIAEAVFAAKLGAMAAPTGKPWWKVW